MLGQASVTDLVDLVQDEVEQVESRDQSRRQVNVGWDGQTGVVFRIDGVRCGQDGSSGIEGGDDSSLGDRHGLLFLQRAALFFRQISFC